MELIDLRSDLAVNCTFADWKSPQSDGFSDFIPKLAILNPNCITYEEFYENFLLGNKPCVFSSEITSDWLSVKDWVTCEDKINFEFLLDKYGASIVSVTTISDRMTIDYGGMDCEDMKFSDYLEYWKKYIANNHAPTMPCLYLKDWHIIQDSKDGYLPYVTPKYFQSDWMNEAWNSDDDFKFAYMGPKGSWTPFHSDVYGSFSWSANIIGQKKWRLYPPGKEKKFVGINNKIKYDYENPGVEDVDYVEVIQKAGEIIFVPSGWHHVVWNIEDAISINHNWMNASNIFHVWHELTNALDEVKLEIADLKNGMSDFSEQCQIILKANYGMDYNMFLEIINTIYKHRNCPEDIICKNFGHDHISFDKKTIEHLYHHHLANNPDFNVEEMTNLGNSINNYCTDLRQEKLHENRK